MNDTDDTGPDHPPLGAAVEARGLRCRYGDMEAVRGIDLTVARGELFALLGTNGAGKTTTMETLEGHRAADGGTVRVLGRDPRRHRRELRPRVGILLQESGFAGELTVVETLELWTRLRSRAGGDGGIGVTLDRVDLAHRRDVAVAQLSGGERRRLDLALAVLAAPEVLFLDEPTSGLDPESRHRTWAVVRELLADGTTVVLTTHYLEEAESLADRIAIMHEGRVAVRGTVADVVATQPARLSFRLPPGAPPPPPLTGTRIHGPAAGAPTAHGQVELRSDALQHDLTTLLRWADEHRVDLGALSARHASLDDVFRSVRAVDDGQIDDVTGPAATTSRSKEPA